METVSPAVKLDGLSAVLKKSKSNLKMFGKDYREIN